MSPVGVGIARPEDTKGTPTAIGVAGPASRPEKRVTVVAGPDLNERMLALLKVDPSITVVDVVQPEPPKLLSVEPVRLRRNLGSLVVAAAMAIAGTPHPDRTPFLRFGYRGEFAVEEIRTGRSGLRKRWRLEHSGAQVELFKTRALALEAAAGIARDRGDSAEDCGRLLAGVRW